MPKAKTIRKRTDSEEIEVTSLSSFIAEVEECCKTEYYLFRGQVSDWPLIPKIGRIKLKKDLLESEKEMVQDFKRLSKPFLTTVPSNELEWLSVAQHYGMATRLLDWTTNPLAAAWFAVSTPCPTDYGVVWMFEPPTSDIILASQAENIDPFFGKRSKVFQPNLTSDRIKTQNSWFTVHKYHEEKKKFIPFEKNILYRKHLKKVVIQASKFSSIRYHLDRLGINERSLFSDLVGTANYVEWMHAYLRDEELEKGIIEDYSLF